MSKAVHLNILEIFRFHYEDEIFKVFLLILKNIHPELSRLSFAFFTRKIKRLFFIEGG